CAFLVACSTTAPSPSQPPPPPPTGDAGADSGGDPYYPADGNGGYDVTAYDVSITYDPPTKHLDGDTTVTATATQDLSRFDLDLTGLDVSNVDIDGAPATFSRAGDHELVITPARAPAKGAVFRTRVRYAGSPGQEGHQIGMSGWQ